MMLVLLKQYAIGTVAKKTKQIGETCDLIYSLDMKFDYEQVAEKKTYIVEGAAWMVEGALGWIFMIF